MHSADSRMHERQLVVASQHWIYSPSFAATRRIYVNLDFVSFLSEISSLLYSPLSSGPSSHARCPVRVAYNHLVYLAHTGTTWVMPSTQLFVVDLRSSAGRTLFPPVACAAYSDGSRRGWHVQCLCGRRCPASVSTAKWPRRPPSSPAIRPDAHRSSFPSGVSYEGRPGTGDTFPHGKSLYLERHRRIRRAWAGSWKCHRSDGG